MMIGRFAATLGVTIAVGVVLQACAKTDAGGDSGSETHWMAKCEQNSDCERGECACGVCTVACRTVDDCPAPLDVCLDARADGVQCRQLICQSSTAGPSPETSGSRESQLQQVIATCDSRRSTNLARVMTTEAQLLEDPGIGVASHVVANVGGGFLLLDGKGAVTRLAADGSFVRKFVAPVEGVSVTDAAVLPDGSAYIAGKTPDGAWLGKVDANWRLGWQKQLSYTPSNYVDVELLPDGSAVVASSGRLPVLPGAEPSEAYVAFWARVSTDGIVAYEKALTYEGAFNGLGMLAVSGTGFHVAISTLLGITLISSDFDGNYTSQSLSEYVGYEIADVRALPDGRVALLDRTQLLVADDTGVLWQYPLEPEVEHALALGYDSARDELVIAGGYRDEDTQAGTWLRSLDISRDTTWELRRLAPPPGLDDASQMGVYGDLLYDVAVDEGGNFLGLGTFRSRHVNVLWVGNTACE
jgi:hypothetical protein